MEWSEFKPWEKRLDIHISFEAGGTFEYPVCDRGGRKAWDTNEKTWRHLSFFHHEEHLHARVPRVE